MQIADICRMSDGVLYFVFICIERLSQVWVYLLLAVVVATIYLINEETSRRQGLPFGEGLGKTLFKAPKSGWDQQQKPDAEVSRVHRTRSKLDALYSGSSAPAISTSTAVFPQFQPLRTSTSVTVLNVTSGIFCASFTVNWDKFLSLNQVLAIKALSRRKDCFYIC